MLDFICRFETMTGNWEPMTTYTPAQVAEETEAELPLVMEILSKAIGRELEVHETMNHREAMCAINAIKEQLAPQIEARKKRLKEQLNKAVRAYDVTMDKIRLLQMQKDWRTAYKTISYFTGSYEDKLPPEYIINLYGECLRIGTKAQINIQELHVWLRKAVMMYREVGSMESIESAIDFVDAYQNSFTISTTQGGRKLLKNTLSLIEDYVQSYHLMSSYDTLMNEITTIEP